MQILYESMDRLDRKSANLFWIHVPNNLEENLNQNVPQKHIATYLGITPESLSRIRSAMKENACVTAVITKK